jgi:hypothetical protein
MLSGTMLKGNVFGNEPFFGLQSQNEPETVTKSTRKTGE